MTRLESFNATPDELIINALREKCGYTLFSAADARAATNCAKWESIGVEAENYITKVIDEVASSGLGYVCIWLSDIPLSAEQPDHIYTDNDISKIVGDIRTYLEALGYDTEAMENVNPKKPDVPRWDVAITIRW